MTTNVGWLYYCAIERVVVNGKYHVTTRPQDITYALYATGDATHTPVRIFTLAEVEKVIVDQVHNTATLLFKGE